MKIGFGPRATRGSYEALSTLSIDTSIHYERGPDVLANIENASMRSLWAENGANGAYLRTYPRVHARIYTRCVRVYSISPRDCRADNRERSKVEPRYRYRG